MSNQARWVVTGRSRYVGNATCDTVRGSISIK